MTFAEMTARLFRDSIQLYAEYPTLCILYLAGFFILYRTWENALLGIFRWLIKDRKKCK